MDTVDYIMLCAVMIGSIFLFLFICFGNIENKKKAFVYWLMLSSLSIVFFCFMAFCKLHPFCNSSSFFSLNWLL